MSRISLLFPQIICCALVFGIGSAAAAMDPFGPADNKSLIFDNFDGGDTDPNRWPFAWWDLGGDYTDGVLEFDLYMDNDDPDGIADKFWTYVNLRVGDNDGALPSGSGNDTMIFDSYRVQSGNGAYYYNNATGPTQHPFLAETAHHVKYTIDGTAKIFTIEVTPYAGTGMPGLVEVDFDGGDPNPPTSDLPWRSQFQLPPPFGAGNTTFDTVAIGGAFGATNGLDAAAFFVDNVVFESGGSTVLSEDFESTPIGSLPDDARFNSLGQGIVGFRLEVVGIPEPGTLGLFAMATIIAGCCFRRRHRD